MSKDYLNIKQEIINQMQVKPVIEAQAEITRRVDFIKQQLLAANKFTLVLGISGGVDSTLCGRLCQQSVQELRHKTNLDEYKFYAVRLPYKKQQDEAVAQLALDFIQPDEVLTVNIANGVDSLCSDITAALDLPTVTVDQLDFVKGNTKARLRMAAQFHLAAIVDGLVVGTDHSAENLMGFYTKFGDGACDLAPLFGLNKRQVISLTKHLGASSTLCDKIPTADLTDNRPLIPDEDVLGVTYSDIDNFLEGLEVEQSAEKTILNKYLATNHKRLPIPTP